MSHEYELIAHDEVGGFRVFLVDLLYRTPHSHRDLELCLMLRGQVEMILSDGSFTAPEGSLFLVNSFAPHELRAKEPALILAVQISPSFFSAYFPQIESLRFSAAAFEREKNADTDLIFEKSFSLAMHYLEAKPFYELQCASLANEIFISLLHLIPHEIISPKEQKAQLSRQAKFRYLTDEIDRRYTERLLLSDLAKEMNVSMYYLSHFFKDSFQMPFQEYLSRVRCEKARQKLLLTDLSLLDISIECGFSDPKYFNRAFKALYGASPKEYRKNFENAPLPAQQQSVLTTQEFLSREASLVLLDKYLRSAG